jgi:hypothetical protein
VSLGTPVASQSASQRTRSRRVEVHVTRRFQHRQPVDRYSCRKDECTVSRQPAPAQSSRPWALCLESEIPGVPRVPPGIDTLECTGEMVYPR